MRTLQTGKYYRNIKDDGDREDSGGLQKRLLNGLCMPIYYTAWDLFRLKKDFLIWSTVQRRHFFAIVHLVPAGVGSENTEKIECSSYSGRGWQLTAVLTSPSLNLLLQFPSGSFLPPGNPTNCYKLHSYFLTRLFYIFSPTPNGQHSCFHLTISSWHLISFCLENRSHRKRNSLSPLVLRCPAFLPVKMDELLRCISSCSISALDSILSCSPQHFILAIIPPPFCIVICSSLVDHV